MSGTGEPKSDINAEIRLHRLKLVICLALVAGLFLTPKLWISSRSYPLMPVSTRLPTIAFPFDYAAFAALVLFTAIVAVLRKPRVSLAILFAVAVSLSLLDQSQWQPWFYQYILMFAVLAPWYWRGSDNSSEAPLNSCRTIVASIYIWSGLHKLSRSFVTSGFLWFLQG